MLLFFAGAAAVLIVLAAVVLSRQPDDSDLHPLLQATRAQRIRNRAIDAFGVVFWIVVALALLGGIIGAVVL